MNWGRVFSFFGTCILLKCFCSAYATDRFDGHSAEEKMITKPRILIVGGGIGGLAFANALEQQGLSYDLYEQKEVWKHVGAGIALPANATWTLQQLGFDHELNTKTQLIKAMSFKTDQDELLIREDITEIHNAGAQFRAIHRADLHKMLFEKLKNSKIHMGLTINAIFQENGSEEVNVELSDGSHKTYDLVVGADGIHSSVRQHIFGHVPLNYQQIATWRTVISTPEDLDHPIYMLGDDTVFLLYPINDNQTYIYAHHIEPERSQDIVENRITKLRALFSGYKGYVPKALDQIQNPDLVIPGWLDSVSEIKWTSGNVVLIGDASHACSPMLQQGGAQAIEDAWILSEELKKGLSHGNAISLILTNFVKRREARVKMIVDESDKRIKVLPEVRNNFIKQNGAPNVSMFRVIMKENP